MAEIDAARIGPDEGGVGDALIVAYHRVDPTARILRYLGIGAAAMSGGSVVMAGAFARLGHASLDFFADQRVMFLGFVLGAVGLSFMTLGGLYAILNLKRILSEEQYLALRTDGALFRDEAELTLCRWEDVEAIRAEGDRVIFVRHDGSEWVRAERFADTDAEALARRAAEVRRKALFGLL